MIKILKFGGTSISNAKCFMHVANIINKKKNKEQIAVVLSAPSGITTKLVTIINNLVKKIDVKYKINNIKNFFSEIIHDLHNYKKNLNFLLLKNFFFKKLKELKKLLYGISLLKNCSDKIYANIICFGEKLSVEIMKTLLASKKNNVFILKPVETFLAYGGYLESLIDINKSITRIKNIFIPEDNIILIAGFIAGNTNRELVVLGRNGSDYSASSLSACLNASICEIWTDVSGIYTSDPTLVNYVTPIKYLSYKEAMELSFFGAKILHPKTIIPLLKYKIPCLVKNTHQPENPGTLISELSNIKDNIKGISYINNVVLVKILISKIVKFTDIFEKIYLIILHINSFIFIQNLSFLEKSISFYIPENKILNFNYFFYQEFFIELNNKYVKYLKINRKLSIITIIADLFNNKLIVKLLNYLSILKQNVVSINYGFGQNTTTIVIYNQNINSELKIINQTFFKKEKILNIFIIGTGNIGNTLIKQIYNLQNNNLQNNISEKKILLRICCICNSKNMLININGIDVSNWQSLMLLQNKKFEINKLLQIATYNNIMDNSVIIDCTNSEKISNNYVNFLKYGFHIITPNKKANTGSMRSYKDIRNVAKISCRKFLYETNVGAGLPVINTLQNLLITGDKFIYFNGILSGSLSFIFGKLDEGKTFSQSILEACKNGLTEPDPRDDLSGMDVARKLLILAREIGFTLELNDIKIPSIFPPNFNTNGTLNNFFSRLPEIDNYYHSLVTVAKKQGQVLRYISSITPQSCKIKIKTLSNDDPLFKVKNGVNALAFYTKNYNPLPLLIQGYGAGNNVTVAGIIADIFKILR